MDKDAIILKYLGDGSQSWGYAPPRDLTEADLERIEKVVGGSRADILRLARFSTGEPLYREVKQKQEVTEHGIDTK